MFTLSASHRAALLFSHHFHPGVPTSYSTVLHCPGSHSSNCVKFMQSVFVCMKICIHAPAWSCKRLHHIHLPCLYLHASLCAMHGTWIAYLGSISSCKNLQRLIYNYFFSTCSSYRRWYHHSFFYLLSLTLTLSSVDGLMWGCDEVGAVAYTQPLICRKV